MNQSSDCLLELLQSGYLSFIKAEFEAEGSNLDEMCMLSNLCCVQNVPFKVKVGGSSAKRDIYEAFQLNASKILVPMVESVDTLSFAFNCFHDCTTKFPNSLVKPEFAINIETVSCIHNLDDIISFNEDYCDNKIHYVIGRSDLAKSMNVDNQDDSDFSKLISDLIIRLSASSSNITVGGGICATSYNNLRVFADLGISSFETRKCSLDVSCLYDKATFISVLDLALQFEINWLHEKNYSVIESIKRDQLRIASLSRRLK